MAGNNSATPERKIKSIRWQLASSFINRKIGTCFGNNILFFFIVVTVWALALEFIAAGNISFSGREHYFIIENKNEATTAEYDKSKLSDSKWLLIDESETNVDEILEAEGEKSVIGIIDGALVETLDHVPYEIWYKVTLKGADTVLLAAPMLLNMTRLLTLLSCFFVFQVVFIWLGYPSERARIGKVLRPLDEIARQAEELSKFDFSEDKYQLIEEKLTNIEPDDNARIRFGDKDLMGIENAMNNLIQRIHESNKQQARFVNDASHELRTPIAVIQGYANMLARWGREDESVLDESITAIQNESQNMNRLVEQLLFLARGDAGRTVINKQPLNLNGVMQEVYEESLMIDENHIYKLSVPENDVIINADEGLIKQAIRILVDNAAKYTKEKDEISLSVGKDPVKGAYLQVQDSGIGMKEADVEHMFERFYRADEARSFNGTGLGLSIAKWIVDKHGGHFEILSREELGTRIGIYLPD